MSQQQINAFSLVAQADDFRQLERSRLRALVKGNIGLARQLHAHDFQLITPTGRSYSGAQYLNEIETGQLRYFMWEPGPIEVRLHDKAVLLRYQAKLEVDSGGGRSPPFKCWHTDFYELRDGFWRVVWSQATAIR